MNTLWPAGPRDSCQKGTFLSISIYFLNGVALDRRFCFAGAAAVLRSVQLLALDRRFVLRHAWMTSCHARGDIVSCQK